MDAVRPVTALLPPAPAAPPVEPTPAPTKVGGSERSLGPAVTVDVRGDAPSEASDKRGYERDSTSQALVYRVTDAASGDVIMQIPDEIVIKARAYARQDASPVGERIEKRA